MPYKISMWIVLFFLFTNAGAAAFTASGAAEYVGIDPSTGADLSERKDNLNEFETGTGLGSTLFGMYNALAGVLEGALNLLPAVSMMKNGGVPDYIANWIYGGLAVVPSYDLIMFLRSG